MLGVVINSLVCACAVPAVRSQTSKKSAYETLVDQVGEVAAKPLKDAEEAAASAPPSPWLAEFSADAAALEERIAKLEDIFQQL